MTAVVEIDARSKLITYGFVRDAQKLWENKFIPPEIAYTCLSFYNSISSKIRDFICSFPLKDCDENELKVFSIRYLESCRWAIYHKHHWFMHYESTVWSDNHCILAIQSVRTSVHSNATSNPEHIREDIIIVSNLGTEHMKLDVLIMEDMVMYFDVSIVDLVQYRFGENYEWCLSGISLEGLNYIKSFMFKEWKKHIEGPLPRSSFSRLLGIGMRTRVYDKFCFPIPKYEKSAWERVSEYGKIFEIPREVYQCRLWSVKQRCYIPVDARMDGAPNDDEKDEYWKNMLDEFIARHGSDYINGLLQQFQSLRTS